MELREALRSGAALEWKAVPPIHPETRSVLSTFLKDRRANAALAKRTEEQKMLLDAVFASRSWRIGFGLTRLWRKLVPSDQETAVDRWKRRGK
jgi:hypothetical protein